MASRFEILGQVDISSAGRTFQAQGQGSRIVLEFSTLFQAKHLLRRLPGPALSARSLSDLSHRLQAAGLTLLIRAGGRSLATLGTQARPGLLSRLLRISPAQLHPLAWLLRR